MEMRKRAEGEGVQSVLIMIDGEGNLGDADEAKRSKAVENHHKWVEAAKFLGCHSIRVNAATGNKGSYEEQQDRAADGLAALADFAKGYRIGVIVENHGGLSSNGAWLAGVMKKVDMPNCGTLPDFGNFRVSRDEEYDRYKGVKELMPHALAVSAKSHDFDEDGNETHTDYLKMMKIVLKAGYHGHVGIEYEGSKLSEMEGIQATKDLLVRVREKLS
jgi:sugar phosphate isomerase/epimerase